MDNKHQVDIKVEYSISPLGGPRKGRLGLYLKVEQPGPVYAEFVDVVFYIPIVFARHVELPVVDKMNIAGKEFFMLRRSDQIIDEILDELKADASDPNKTPESYTMNWTWELPSDIRRTELEEAKYIQWSLLACVEPIRLSGTIEKASYSTY